ncbi:TetR/AcrR family transcriptional regulator [Occultella glacieicola]|uniref:TetR/AcrR family transcriptional regulator n=1 Tax=Occultella glacieicola TaxID=2518684 RepID=A0ABY2E1I3_9MICO|nr:TetR/AcrR family transcriptional regulator [Occultella glacieicola]TDE92475.1 TetR/AcrR family transcriptional regulator [Occultella glacieicola]
MSTIDPAAAPASSRSERVHAAILGAAEEVFLRDGYVGSSMDEVARISGSSKQTVYKHFGNKEQLFEVLVSSMTDDTGAPVGHETPGVAGDVGTNLTDLAVAMLDAVLTPRILRLRRLVIGEANRFPDLGRALFEHGPERAIAGVQRRLAGWVAAGVLPAHDTLVAARHYNWLVMGGPLNAAMLLGDGAIPSPAERRAHAQAAVTAFLRSIGHPSAT